MADGDPGLGFEGNSNVTGVDGSVRVVAAPLGLPMLAVAAADSDTVDDMLGLRVSPA
jgi:hypothetical protein